MTQAEVNFALICALIAFGIVLAGAVGALIILAIKRGEWGL